MGWNFGLDRHRQAAVGNDRFSIEMTRGEERMSRVKTQAWGGIVGRSNRGCERAPGPRGGLRRRCGVACISGGRFLFVHGNDTPGAVAGQSVLMQIEYTIRPGAMGKKKSECSPRTARVR